MESLHSPITIHESFIRKELHLAQPARRGGRSLPLAKAFGVGVPKTAHLPNPGGLETAAPWVYDRGAM